MSKLLPLCLYAAIAGAAFAQEAAEPAPALSGTPGREETHIMGVVPNYATVNDPARPFIAISAREKFKIAAEDAFDPFSWVITGIYAGAAQWGNNYAQFGQGAQGYAKRYGAAFADGAIGNYMTEAILPSLLHEDPRYFRMGTGSPWKRAGYAVSRVLVTRSDAGRARVNNSELEGNLLAAAIANLYYPPANRSIGNTFEKFAVNVVSDAGFNVLKEFWPDMRRKVLHRGDGDGSPAH